MDAAHDDNRPKLGDVLVTEGLISAEELEAALAEQRQTGERLGQLLVRWGLISGPAIANALADQSGGIVRTEYGVATGFKARNPAAEAAAPPTMDEELARLGHELERKSVQVDQLRADLAKARAALAQVEVRSDADDNGPDREDFVVVANVNGRFVVELGRGRSPQPGTQLRLPNAPATPVVVTRTRWRRCLYAEPAETMPAAS